MPGIDEPEKIDVIAEDVDGSALLSIVQSGAWAPEGAGRNRLKRKLGTYLRYALEGQMVAAYPTLEGRPVVIELACEQPPPDALRQYWQRRGRDVAREGVTLRITPLDEVIWRA